MTGVHTVVDLKMDRCWLHASLNTGKCRIQPLHLLWHRILGWIRSAMGTGNLLNKVSTLRSKGNEID
jgi:hypothetical protein